MQTHLQEQSQSTILLNENQNSLKYGEENFVKGNPENYNERIEGTPLMVVKQMNDQWLVVFGMYKIKEFDSKIEAKEYIKNNMLNIVVDMISIIVEFHNNQNQKIKTNE